MRLILLPVSTKQTLVYAHRLAPPTPAQTSLVDRITARAATQWRKWESAEKGWQRKVTGWGNTAFARIPFPEWGLKSVPPLSKKQRQLEETAGKYAHVDVIFPANVLPAEQVKGTLARLASERQSLHRRGMWYSIAGFPLTIPFGLIPIIPNLPFFYLAFRAWSHWKALAGSRHIEYLLKHHALSLRPNSILQHVYNLRTVSPEQLAELRSMTSDDKADGLHEDDVQVRNQRVETFLAGIDKDPNRTATIMDTGVDSKEELLLERSSGALVSRCLGVPGIDVEIERACDQITTFLETAQATSFRGNAQTDVKGESYKTK